MIKDYQLETTSKKHFRTTMKCLLAMGYAYHGHTNLEEIVNTYGKYPWLAIYPSTKQINGNTGKKNMIPESPVTTLDQLAKLEEDINPIVTVKLNDSYNAEVSKDGIKVGCQTFSSSIIADLSAALNKIEDLIAADKK